MVAPITVGGLVFCPCFVMLYIVSFYSLQSSCRGTACVCLCVSGCGRACMLACVRACVLGLYSMYITCGSYIFFFFFFFWGGGGANPGHTRLLMNFPVMFSRYEPIDEIVVLKRPSSIAHTDVSSGARGLNVDLNIYLHPYFVYRSIEAMRGSRNIYQRGSNFDNVFFV